MNDAGFLCLLGWMLMINGNTCHNDVVRQISYLMSGIAFAISIVAFFI